jgi:hypothetical protein
MSTSQKRRIVKRVAVALAGVVLLVTAYLSTLGVIFWMNGRGYLSDSTRVMAETTVFAPIRLYREAELPGADVLNRFLRWAWSEGSGLEIRGHPYRLRQKDGDR